MAGRVRPEQCTFVHTTRILVPDTLHPTHSECHPCSMETVWCRAGIACAFCVCTVQSGASEAISLAYAIAIAGAANEVDASLSPVFPCVPLCH